MSAELIVGLMSGTSIDGIDAALVRFATERQAELIGTHFIKFDQDLKNSITNLAHFQGDLTQTDYLQVDNQLAELYAQTSLELIAKNGFTSQDISAIANHGQTIRHRPDAHPPISVQLGDTQQIANLTGIQTIGQFRQGDLAVGGQGAPLMPAFHQAVFTNDMPTGSRYLVNIGGIANVTRLTLPEEKRPTIGFDTGPGNTLLDQWISQHQQASYDHDGEWAGSGKVIPELLNRLMEDPYFKASYPKSTGTDYFNLSWLSKQAPTADSYEPQHVQATLLQLTVETICGEVKQLESERIDTTANTTPLESELYVCGGGAHNRALMAGLSDALPHMKIESTANLGIPPDWVEAMGFAWLGYCYLHGIDSNLPSVTGASKNVVLGDACQPAPTAA